MNRRQFLTTSAAAAATPALTSALDTNRTPPRRGKRFKLKYAPHFGMFRNHAGDDLLDQLQFMADQGFEAIEDNGMPGRPIEMQEKIGAKLEALGMQMGVFVAHADFGNPTFAVKPADARERIEADMRRAVDVAKRVNAKWCTVVPGSYRKNVEWDYQTANVIDNLRFAADIVEPAGLTMVLEPLNWWSDHAGVFLTKISQGFLICRAVNRPSCKILDDLYHQQITEGHLIRNIDQGWDEIAYFQVGDNPGRKEPTTGEINYKNVFRHIHGKGFEGIVGMEHGISKPGKEGEVALIRAYEEVDAFDA
ncbi:MAG: TIM barrel protein [Planctomycetes bacterium]|nr:TIM barrel protein [Planctomycetota bacterium]